MGFCTLDKNVNIRGNGNNLHAFDPRYGIFLHMLFNGWLLELGSMTQRVFIELIHWKSTLEDKFLCFIGEGGQFAVMLRRALSNTCMNDPLQLPSRIKAHVLYVFQVKRRKKDSQSDYINTNPNMPPRNKRTLYNPKPRYFYAPWFWISCNKSFVFHNAVLYCERGLHTTSCLRSKGSVYNTCYITSVILGLLPLSRHTHIHTYTQPHVHIVAHLVAETKGDSLRNQPQNYTFWQP